jgi:hypothetical protein
MLRGRCYVTLARYLVALSRRMTRHKVMLVYCNYNMVSMGAIAFLGGYFELCESRDKINMLTSLL